VTCLLQLTKMYIAFFQNSHLPAECSFRLGRRVSITRVDASGDLGEAYSSGDRQRIRVVCEEVLVTVGVSGC